MAGERKAVTENKKKMAEAVVEAENDAQGAEMEAFEAQEPATAKNIPRPATTLRNPPKTKLGKLRVSFLGDLTSAPSLEELAKFNKEPASQGRTPLISVIQAVLAKAGGTMNLDDLASEALQHWNRPLPTTPYTPEQFVYVIVRNSDVMKVSE